MLIAENNTYKIGAVVVAAFGYQTETVRKMFVKETETQYRQMKTKRLISYRSLTTLDEARKNKNI